MNDADVTVTEQFLQKIQNSLQDDTFVRLLFTMSSAATDAPRKILGRLINLRGKPHLMLTFRYDTKDAIRNVPVPEAMAAIRHHLPATSSVLLGTTVRDWQLVLAEGQEPRLASHKASAPGQLPRTHDRPKQSWLDDSARPWLEGLGILDDRGRVRSAMADKHQQIERYLEVLSHLITDCGWNVAASGTGAAPLHVADMGCGKGHLTFAAWHLFRRMGGRTAQVLGVDVRPDLMEKANGLARKIEATGLSFEAGTIAEKKFERLDILVALHACNTATDDAIRRGIELGTQLILTAPCCHQEIRPQLGKPEPLAAVLEHGIMAERMAEWVTDGLRTLHLEWAGYRTKLIEFVASEHTPKNLLLAAVKHDKPFADPARRERIQALKRFFGINGHALDPLLERSGEA